MEPIKEVKQEHDCEFFLVTDVAVYACECEPNRLLVGDHEYVESTLYTSLLKENESLKAEVERLKSIDSKDWEKCKDEVAKLEIAARTDRLIVNPDKSIFWQWERYCYPSTDELKSALQKAAVLYATRQKESEMKEILYLKDKINEIESEYRSAQSELSSLKAMNNDIVEQRLRSGLFANDGTEIKVGHMVWWRTPYRTTQTHVGDNIPNGSYTEPMEPGIKIEEGEVVFEEGMFGIKDLEGYGTGVFPLSWCIRQWTLDDLEQYIGCPRFLFDAPEEGDLQYLMEEVAKVKTTDELLQYISGIHIYKES